MELITEPRLKSWIALNDAMRDADEALCKTLLDAEVRGRRRKQFMKRIHSRMNRVRAARERAELEARSS